MRERRKGNSRQCSVRVRTLYSTAVHLSIFFTFTGMPEIDASAAPGTPEPPRQAGPKAGGGGGGSILTKGKWLKITRKGLLVTAMSRIGKDRQTGEASREGGLAAGMTDADESMHGSHFLNPDRRTLTRQPADSYHARQIFGLLENKLSQACTHNYQ